jgi:PDZ domain-containing protein
MTELPPASASPGPAQPPVPPPVEPPVEPPAAPPPRRHTVLAVVVSTVGVLLAVVAVAGFLIHLPYVIISPGSATPLDASVVQIDGAPTYAHTASVQFLTVRVSTSDPNLWRVVASWLDPDRDVVKRKAVVGCLSDAQNQAFNTELMDQSQNDAKYVALTRLGYQVKADPVQIRIVEVCHDAPAHDKLVPSDRVLAVDGHDVTRVKEVGSLVQAHRPGDKVAITYERDGTTRTATIVAGKASPDRRACVAAQGSTTGITCLGITSQEFVTYQFPIDISINTQRVGGPSAGLAFTLAIIDDLTPGSLTGGKSVAVTGAIAPDGTVGEVGGVEQKAITARTNGVQLMIVPKPEVADARRGAGKVRVVGVENVDQALAALRAVGGAPVPPPSTTAARS